jgi:hypothetical protein
MAYAGVVTPLLPVLIVVAFAQYVIDSYYYYHQKQLRMSVLGRWNGILYFVPIVTLACAGFPLLQRLPVDFAWLVQAMGWLLVLSTVLSIADRALAPLRVRHEAGR